MTLDLALLICGAVAAAAGIVWRRRLPKSAVNTDAAIDAVADTGTGADMDAQTDTGADTGTGAGTGADTQPDTGGGRKRRKRRRMLPTALALVGGYVFTTRLIRLLFGAVENEGMEVSIWPERVDFFGVKLTTTVIHTWYVMAFILVLALALRLTVLRRLKDQPRGLQNALELAIEKIRGYTDSQAHGAGEFLASYIFSVTLFLVSCAALEMFGLRTPASDLMLTFALALITFVLINVYGVRKKGLSGRIKALASPTPVVFIIRVVTDVAIPVSMASRLFGNMLGGMIVMDLVYSSLGGNAVGLPSLVGLYFNVFHPLIQAFIFVTLTLTFINEAIE